jgi:DNA-3-methyladenine glycosylase II
MIEEIIKHKGIGRWTGTIMALFHFGREDIYPDLDGSLQKVNEILYDLYQIKIDTALAKPYRSYLAYYFWHFLDKGLLTDKIKK